MLKIKESTVFKRIDPVFLVLALLWMIFIFFMSSRDAVQSGGYSSKVGETVCRFLLDDFDQKPVSEQLSIVDSIETPLRKLAHFTEFTILGILMFPAFSSFKTAFLLSAVYAVSDELHQLFVPGRSCELRDMLIDITGVCLGLLMIRAFYQLRQRIRRSSPDEA